MGDRQTTRGILPWNSWRTYVFLLGVLGSIVLMAVLIGSSPRGIERVIAVVTGSILLSFALAALCIWVEKNI